MGRFLTLSIRHDPDTDRPDSGFDGWRLVSFGVNQGHPEDPGNYVKAFDRGTGAVTPASAALKTRLNAGLAFWVSFHEYGAGSWSLMGEGPQCPWDTAYLAGVLVWTGNPGDIGEDTLEGRAKDARNYLECFTAWANGHTYWFRLTDRNGRVIESFGGVVGIEALSGVVGEDLRPGDSVVVEGDASWLRDQLRLPEGVTLVGVSPENVGP